MDAVAVPAHRSNTQSPCCIDTDDGTALVEFALVAGLLLTLLGGIVTYGLLLSFHQVLTQAATDGARAASLAVDDPATATDERIAAARAAVDASLDAVDRTCPSVGDDNGLTCSISVLPCPNDATQSCIFIDLLQDHANHPVVPDLFFVGLAPDTIGVDTMALVNGA